MSNGVEYIDYIIVDGRTIRPESIRARFDTLREQIFNLPIRQVPIKKESDYALTNNMDANEIYALDHSYYDLTTPTSDRRIKNQFQYYTYLLSGIGHNISVLLGKKREILRWANELDVVYNQIYASAINTYGVKALGTNDSLRTAWMMGKYPALTEIRQLYKNFLDEIDVEYERLDKYQTIVSRCLTGMENDVKMRGEYAFGNPSDKAQRF